MSDDRPTFWAAPPGEHKPHIEISPSDRGGPTFRWLKPRPEPELSEMNDIQLRLVLAGLRTRLAGVLERFDCFPQLTGECNQIKALDESVKERINAL